MMQRLPVVASILALLTLVLGVTPAFAQEVSQPASDVAELEVLETTTRPSGLVELVVAAPGSLAGIEVPSTGFGVTVDGLAKPIRVDRIPNDALEIVVAIDVSGSMQGEPIRAAKEAAASFVRLLPPTAEVAVVGFSDTAVVASPLGSTAAESIAAVNALEVGGETAMYDAVDLSLDQFGTGGAVRRTLVLLSDGGDTASTNALAETVTKVAASEADVYAIALATSESEAGPLAELTESTGGRVLTASDTAALRSLYDTTAAVLASQYRITFDPLTAEPGTATVVVAHLGIAATAPVAFGAQPTTSAAGPEDSGEEGTQVSRAASPIRTSVVSGNWLTGRGALLAGLFMLGAALAIIGLLAFLPGTNSNRGPRRATIAAPPGASIDSAKERATDLAERMLARNDRGRMVGLALERAGMELRPAEFTVVVMVSAVAAALLGAMFAGVLGAIAFFGLMLVGARMALSFKARRRTARFAEQLTSTIQLIAGSLRAGYALPQAAEMIAHEASAPTSDEFHRIVTEHRLGRDFGESLRAAANRLKCDDFTWVVHAIEIHREVGGDLAEVLDNVNSTIRDRNFVRRQFAALSAEGRYSAYLIVSLPFAVFFATALLNPDYNDILLTDGRGRLTLVAAGLLIAVGSFWMKKIIKVRY